MNIIIASSNRSHLLDVATELSKLNNNVTFITFTPRWRLKRYDISLKIVKSVFKYCFLGILLVKLIPSDLSRELLRIMLDWSVSFQLKPCDIFICQSPHFKRSMRIAKNKYGATIILDRGSNHVRFYNEQLKKVGARTMREWYMKLDEAQYHFADYISLASTYCKETFIKYGISPQKLFCNPYGVNVSNFRPTKLDEEDSYDVLYVGNLSKNKGSDLLIKVCDELNLSFIHVGNIIDVYFPTKDRFKHINPVSEDELINYYKKGKIFVMPSHNEGFGLVLIQATICGLPIVTTKYTGGPDIKKLINDKNYIYIIKDINEENLKNGIIEALNKANDQMGIRSYVKDFQSIFSWEAHASRYNNFLQSICQSKYK